MKLAVKCDGGARVTLRPFLLEAKVMPEAERRAIRSAVAIDGTAHAFLGREVRGFGDGG